LFYFIGVKEAVVSAFEGVTQWEKKVVAFGADGASVNLGKKAGVTAHSIPDRFSLSSPPA